MGYELKLGSSSGSYSSRQGSSCSTGYSSHSMNSRASPVFSRSSYLPNGSGTGDYNGNPENKLGMRLDL